MSDMVAHARDLLPWSKWPPAGAQDPIAARLAAAGFRTSDGVSYARIGDSDSPRALHIGERTPRIMVQLTLPIWFWIVVVVALARCL